MLLLKTVSLNSLNFTHFMLFNPFFDKHSGKPDALVLGGSAVGHESNNNLVLAITYLHFRRLGRTLLPMSFVRMLMPDCITATTPENIRCYRDGLGKRRIPCLSVSASAWEELGAPQLVSTHRDSRRRRVSFSQDTVYQAIRKMYHKYAWMKAVAMNVPV